MHEAKVVIIDGNVAGVDPGTGEHFQVNDFLRKPIKAGILI